MAIRLKDIAADVGVSIVTVSKVLLGKSDVGPETRKRILKRVEELNYRPNMIARGLASGRSHTVGLIVPDLVDSFFAEFAKSLSATLRSHSYQLILASADGNATVEESETENLLARGVDALLLASSQERSDRVRPMFERGIPCILIDRTLPGLKAHFVGTDDIRVGRLATDHLISLKRNRIAHIGLEGISTSVERHEGYRQALQGAGLRYRKELVMLRGLQDARADHLGSAATNQLLASAKPPDAIFCYSDLIAVGAIRSVLGNGLRVPADVAVIGCGNLTLSEYLEVPLSSVDQGTAQLGQKAAKLALSLIEGKNKNRIRSIYVEPSIIKRASTIGANPGL